MQPQVSQRTPHAAELQVFHLKNPQSFTDFQLSEVDLAAGDLNGEDQLIWICCRKNVDIFALCGSLWYVSLTNEF